MEELVVTRYWMAGVMAVMVIFGLISLFGVMVKRKRDEASRSPEDVV